MKTRITFLLMLLFFSISMLAQDYKESVNQQPDMNKLQSIVMAETFCSNIGTIVASMPDNFWDIKGVSSGGGSGGLGGGISMSSSPITWEPTVQFEGVETEGVIGNETIPEVVETEFAGVKSKETIYHDFPYCEYLLLEGSSSSDWNAAFYGTLEVLQQCMPQVDASSWQNDDEGLRSSITMNHEDKRYTISLSVNYSIHLAAYGLILEFKSN
ncbi:MAG: hypothetical protein JW798_02050 [Prolixibacteraceae bacterium]|nr:hypothetical protein [Prolixibacteraceae bacterium]